MTQKQATVCTDYAIKVNLSISIYQKLQPQVFEYYFSNAKSYGGVLKCKLFQNCRSKQNFDNITRVILLDYNIFFSETQRISQFLLINNSYFSGQVNIFIYIISPSF